MSICECGACGLDAGVYSMPHYINSVNVGGKPKRFIQGHAIGVAVQEGKRTRDTATHCAKGHLKSEYTTDKGKCGECAKLAGTKWRASHPVERLAIARKHMYKITDEAYKRMLFEQNHKCLVCSVVFDSDGKKTVPCIDHDHACCPGNKSCGKCIRGVICYGCNVMLGFAKDNPETLLSGAKYLKEKTQQWNSYSGNKATSQGSMEWVSPSFQMLSSSELENLISV